MNKEKKIVDWRCVKCGILLNPNKREMYPKCCNCGYPILIKDLYKQDPFDLIYTIEV